MCDAALVTAPEFEGPAKKPAVKAGLSRTIHQQRATMQSHLYTKYSQLLMSSGETGRFVWDKGISKWGPSKPFAAKPDFCQKLDTEILYWIGLCVIQP